MRTMTATRVSRGFSEVLDAVQHGDTITITRAGVPVAELRPVPVASGRALSDALDASTVSLDDTFEADITAATKLLSNGNPWPDA
ncbi:type II toxin-antitoxin system prevent-host-death family antitoxin [Cellulomonas sp. DKR-3]|uniref:Type II toxin-antitoxin system prevent-host-death family antitoxin n=1 Tax=Cellulomonas fulva TaxID=2835530 RepID=A0ABS5TVQ1_9CELL|nr:type II toxin-antitoxin system prevent-host-death family antitoxin [Cellulomonas fulva]MBT0993211.1 type II toxin-antitoxin system prevent-host-death family antitoxin [Cellulomonas fulva]